MESLRCDTTDFLHGPGRTAEPTLSRTRFIHIAGGANRLSKSYYIYVVQYIHTVRCIGRKVFPEGDGRISRTTLIRPA